MRFLENIHPELMDHYSSMLAFLPITALLLAGCTTDITVLASRCDVALDSVEPAQAWPGESVVVTGAPFTTSFDTAVYVGGERATVVSLDRDDCAACDDCRTDNGCNSCSDCDECDAICKTDCVETATIVVPGAAPGSTTVSLFNSHGESQAIPFTVLGESDTGTDTGDTASDTGDTAPDTGDTAPDTGDTAADTGDTAS